MEELRYHIQGIKNKVREFTGFDKIFSPIKIKEWYSFCGSEFIIHNPNHLEKLRTEVVVKEPSPFIDYHLRLYLFAVDLAHELLHNIRFRKNPLKYILKEESEGEHNLIHLSACRIALSYIKDINPCLVGYSRKDEILDNVMKVIFKNFD